MPVRIANIPKHGFGLGGPTVRVKVKNGVSAESADRILANQNGVSVSDLANARWDFLESAFEDNKNSTDSSSASGCISNVITSAFKFFILIIIGGVLIQAINSSDDDEPNQGQTNTFQNQPFDSKARQRPETRTQLDQRTEKEGSNTRNSETISKRERSACQIWAEANPALASKLKNGDRCFEEIQ